MTKPGPKPRPTRLKLLAGERPSRVNRAEPIPARAEVKMPRGMSPAAQRMWRRLAPDLLEKNIVTSWDVDALQILCETASVHLEARRVLGIQGLLVPGRRDGLVTNPAWRIYRDSAQLFKTYATDFGLTPSSRSRLSNAPETDDAEIEALLVPARDPVPTRGRR